MVDHFLPGLREFPLVSQSNYPSIVHRPLFLIFSLSAYKHWYCPWGRKGRPGFVSAVWCPKENAQAQIKDMSSSEQLED